MNKSAALAKKLLRTASAHPSTRPSLMSKVARLLKQGQAVEATLTETRTAAIGKGDEVEWTQKGVQFKGKVTDTKGVMPGEYTVRLTEMAGQAAGRVIGITTFVYKKDLRAVEATLHTAKFGDKAEQAKMWAKGYRFIILLEKDKATPLYTKTLAQASKLMRTDHKDEKNYKIDPLKDPKGKDASDKLAGKDTSAFAAWAIARGKRYTERECTAMLDRLKVPFIALEERAAPKRGPLAVGETVSPNPGNTNEFNQDAIKRYLRQHGQVEAVDKDGVAVRWDDNKLVRFEGPNSPGKALGLGRSTRPSVVTERSEGKAQVEVIYISDKNAKPPSKDQIQQVQDYVDKGILKGEKRNRSYYSGLALKQAEGKNGYYFTLFAQGRDTFPRSMNPKKGTVMYIGRLGGRPGGWKSEYEAMMSKATGDE